MAKKVHNDANLLKLKEQIEALSALKRDALRCYRPLPHALPFHLSTASERIARGGNRAGKTIAWAAEIASAFRGIPITGLDGKLLPFHWQVDNPRRKTTAPLLIWVVGFDQRHIGQTLYRLLCQPGAFDVIQDERTMEWRIWQPWSPADQARSQERKPAEPFIPPHEIENIAWENRGSLVFDTIRHKNGNVIHAFSSTGEPKQGDPVDLIGIDEDMRWSRHVGEFQARISDRAGSIVWAAFPWSRNNALVDMSERASKQKEEVERGLRMRADVEEFIFTFEANPFIDDDEKRKRLEGWEEEEARARNLGEFTHDTVMMYQFNAQIHGCPLARGYDPLSIFYEQNNNSLPTEWTRYLVLDPGHTTTAVAFFAVPPPPDFVTADFLALADRLEERGDDRHLMLRHEKGFGDVVVLEDELYIHKASAEDVARRVRDKIGGLNYEAFLIDRRAGVQTQIGRGVGRTIKMLYVEAFDKFGIASRVTGSNFHYASPETEHRREVFRSWLTVRDDGPPKFRVVTAKCPGFMREIATYRKRITSDKFIEDKPAKSAHDMIDAVEYMAAYNPAWVPPAYYKPRASHAYKMAMAMLAEEKKPSAFELGPGYYDKQFANN